MPVLVLVGIGLTGLADILVSVNGLREPEFGGAVVGLGLVALTLLVLATAAWLGGHRGFLLVVAVMHMAWGIDVCVNQLRLGELPTEKATLLVVGGAVLVVALAVGRNGVRRSDQQDRNE